MLKNFGKPIGIGEVLILLHGPPETRDPFLELRSLHRPLFVQEQLQMLSLPFQLHFGVIEGVQLVIL